MYNKKGVGETVIVDFDRNLTFNTGVAAYFGGSNLSFLVSPDGSKIILPGEEVGIFNSSPLSFIDSIFAQKALAMARDPELPLFILDLSLVQKHKISGDFLIGPSFNDSRFIWLDDNSFCYHEIHGMQPSSNKIWKINLSDEKQEVAGDVCHFPAPSENPITQEYILGYGGYLMNYETKIKNPDTNEEVLLKPNADCRFTPSVALSPNEDMIALACDSETHHPNYKYIYILPVKDVFQNSYGEAVKVIYKNAPSIQWLNENQLLVTTFIGNKSLGEAWNTTEVSLIDLNGNHDVLVPAGSRVTSGPVIAPNKNAFVYETIVEGEPNSNKEGNEEIVVMSIDKEVLYRFPGTYPRWIE